VVLGVWWFRNPHLDVSIGHILIVFEGQIEIHRAETKQTLIS